jgi:hypothetical protein
MLISKDTSTGEVEKCRSEDEGCSFSEIMVSSSFFSPLCFIMFSMFFILLFFFFFFVGLCCCWIN